MRKTASEILRNLESRIARLERSAMMGVYVNVDSMGYYSAVDAFHDFQKANPRIRSTMYDNGSGYDISFEFDSKKHANAFKRFMMEGHYNQDKRFVRITES
tara:strand:+ start:460 stop:762 length:303 start_codon:yes stop_codon:yes gene_type:complete